MHIEAAYVKFQNQPYKIVPDPNNMDDIKFIKLDIHTAQAEVDAWCQDFKILSDIKKELVMFAIVKYGRSSSLIDLKVIFP